MEIKFVISGYDIQSRLMALYSTLNGHSILVVLLLILLYYSCQAQG